MNSIFGLSYRGFFNVVVSIFLLKKVLLSKVIEKTCIKHGVTGEGWDGVEGWDEVGWEGWEGNGEL